MKFYKDRFGDWHKEDKFFGMSQIFMPAFPGKTFSEKFFTENGCISAIVEFQSEPTVIDYLKFGMNIDAVWRYYHIHGGTLAKAREMVEKIKKDMEEMKND